MILPLVQDILLMSAQSLWTSLPQENFDIMKVVVMEKWQHIEIVETELQENIRGFRTLVQTHGKTWIIKINSNMKMVDKRKTLIHELMHCFIDEFEMSDKSKIEETLKIIEENIDK